MVDVIECAREGRLWTILTRRDEAIGVAIVDGADGQKALAVWTDPYLANTHLESNAATFGPGAEVRRVSLPMLESQLRYNVVHGIGRVAVNLQWPARPEQSKVWTESALELLGEIDR
jgi:hypothetical protein